MNTFKLIGAVALVLTLTQNSMAADRAIPPAPEGAKVELPEQMKALGFKLDPMEISDPDSPLKGQVTYRLSVPTPGVSAFYSMLGDNNGIQKNGHFTDFDFEQKNNAVRVSLKTSNGERAEYNIDLKKKTLTYMDWDPSGKPAHESPIVDVLIPNANAAKEVAKLRKEKPDSPDFIASNYSEATGTLSIVEKSSGKVIRDAKLKLPKGMTVDIVDGRFLVIRDGGKKSFELGGFSLNGKSDTAILDISEYLQKANEKADGRNVNCAGDFQGEVDRRLFSENGFAMGGSHGSLQKVVDDLIQGKRFDETRGGRTSSEGFKLFTSSTGRSSLFINPSRFEEDDAIKAGANWGEICGAKLISHDASKAVYEVTDQFYAQEQNGMVKTPWRIELDLDSGKYTATKAQ